eukprot:TRINITY_DN38076_c0_g1_i1.p1 TRINITY_DN38076_c0_g1~~TRINITY_DN38076_c0_g1_i1.p1  ORF type:complete len:101 (+),score=2.47 TRINITY_DN38076_c0_g1_i1:151-453(+)
MIIGRPLFPGDSQIGTIFKIFNLLGTPSVQSLPLCDHLPHFNRMFQPWPRKAWSEIEDLASRLSLDGLYLLGCMLVHDPMKRTSASKALQSDYFLGAADT